MEGDDRLYLGAAADRGLIRRILDWARAHDLNRGDLYDARSGVVNIWCAPEDKPRGWDAPIDCGALKFPRAYVGELGWEWDGEEAALFVEAAPYGLFDRRRALPDGALAACLDWLAAKARILLDGARAAPEVVGVHCPFCSFVLPVGELINDLLGHIGAAHPGREMRSVTIGGRTVLETAEDTYPLLAATEGSHRDSSRWEPTEGEA